MMTFLLGFCLLANSETMPTEARSLQDPMLLRGLGIVLATGMCVGLVWAAIHYWKTYRAQAAAAMQTPAYLFQELCQTHQLSAAERTLLQQSVLDPNDLPQAFINPDYLEILSRSLTHESTACRDLRFKLFGQI